MKNQERLSAQLNTTADGSLYFSILDLAKGWDAALYTEKTLQGFETQISRYVDDGLTVVVLTNLAQAKPELIADGVAAIYLSTPHTP